MACQKFFTIVNYFFISFSIGVYVLNHPDFFCFPVLYAAFAAFHALILSTRPTTPSSVIALRIL